MLAVGPHLSISKGLCDALDVALSIGATTFQFFSRNPRGGASKPLDDTDLSNFINYKYILILLSKNKFTTF